MNQHFNDEWRDERLGNAVNNHLESLGCIAIPREKYLQLLASAIQP